MYVCIYVCMIYLYVYVHLREYAHTQNGCGDQRSLCGVKFPLPLCKGQGLNLGHQVWWQASLPIEPSCWFKKKRSVKFLWRRMKTRKCGVGEGSSKGERAGGFRSPPSQARTPPLLCRLGLTSFLVATNCHASEVSWTGQLPFVVKGWGWLLQTFLRQVDSPTPPCSSSPLDFSNWILKFYVCWWLPLIHTFLCLFFSQACPCD